MSLVLALIAGLFGLLIGSFLNACIYRLPRDITLWEPARSFCPHCEASIAWYDNIPALSYLLLRGKCRHCAEPIPIRYFLVELLCGIMYFIVVLQLGLTASSLKLLLFIAINVALVFTDYEERILPDEFTKGGMIVGPILAYFVLLPPVFTPMFLPRETSPNLLSVAESLFAIAFGYGVFYAIGYVWGKLRNRDVLGLGDLKMVGMLGAFMGLMPMLFAIMVGSLLGSVIGITYIVSQKKEASSYELPYGTFLGIAAIGVAWTEAVHAVGQAVVH